jgi:hypothetical protein
MKEWFNMNDILSEQGCGMNIRLNIHRSAGYIKNFIWIDIEQDAICLTLISRIQKLKLTNYS